MCWLCNHRSQALFDRGTVRQENGRPDAVHAAPSEGAAAHESAPANGADVDGRPRSDAIDSAPVRVGSG